MRTRTNLIRLVVPSVLYIRPPVTFRTFTSNFFLLVFTNKYSNYPICSQEIYEKKNFSQPRSITLNVQPARVSHWPWILFRVFFHILFAVTLLTELQLISLFFWRYVYSDEGNANWRFASRNTHQEETLSEIHLPYVYSRTAGNNERIIMRETDVTNQFSFTDHC